MNVSHLALDQSKSSSDGASSIQQDRERIQRQILSGVSHDLKTPLASIIGSLEVLERLKDKLTEEKKQTLIRVALEEAHRLDTFVSNILEMAKLENELVKVHLEQTSISALVTACAQRINNRLPQDQAIQIALAPDAFMVTTDPLLLSWALGLILDNAIKYGGTPPHVQIALGTKDNKHGFISVRDNGQGIESSRLETIFEKYTRFPRADQHAAGHGLGLAICKAVMKLLKGDVTAGNHAEGGAVFTLYFPLN